MAEMYSSELLRVVIAQIAQTIGYSNTQSAPLELLQDILQRFIQELARDLHSQAEHANRVEPNLKDVQLSLKNLATDVHELLDYIGNVEPVPFVREVPEYPIKRNSNLNFLKPGSVETLTRPVHIFEYLPPILPTDSSSSGARGPGQTENEQGTSGVASELRSDGRTDKLLDEIKSDLSESPMTLNSASDIEGHAIREISSVVMTTGGFISPAIEGKLPEAFVPDIIEKLKGLDAPPKSPPAESTTEVIRTLSTDIPLVEASDKTFNEVSPNLHVEAGTVVATSGLTLPGVDLPLPTQTKATKKIKKKHLIRNDNNMELINAHKAQEKAHRKALRMFQKLSKTQDVSVATVVGDNSGVASRTLSLKKSIKNLNRGMLTALPAERTQLEKLLKKQTKQRQKQLKSQKQQRQALFNASGPSGPDLNQFNITPTQTIPTVSAINVAQPVLPELPSVHLPLLPLIGNYTFGNSSLVHDKKDKFSTEGLMSVSTATTSISPEGFPDEIKLANEPDRNKLNIFKKISKPKTPKAPSPAPTPLPMGLNMATNLFGNDAPLINLPSGTTITPAPALNTTEGVQSLNNDQSAMVAMSADLHRPKKRGRKPGGKNSIKSTDLTPKKPKVYKSGAVNPTLHQPLPLGLATEPLNLSQVDQVNTFASVMTAPPVETDSIKGKKVKEKKERKKAKLKERLEGQQLNEKFPFMDTTKLTLTPESPVLNQPPLMGVHHGYMPGLTALPLLPFPPRPGLIPSGMFSPTSLANFGKKPSCPSKMITHPFGDRSSAMGFRPAFMDTTEHKSGLSVLPLGLPESHLERSYCNVAPLVPESMKLTSLQMDASKTNSTEPHVIDANAEHDREHKGNNSSYSAILTKYLPTVQGIGSALMGSSDLSMVQNLESSSVKTVKPMQPVKIPAGTGNLGDPIEVSDDSSDDVSSNPNKIEKKDNSKEDLLHKSSIMQTMNLPQQFETSNPYSMTDSNQMKKLPKAVQPIKMNQLDNNPLKPIVPSTSSTSSFNINFMGNDKFSLAGGADLIPLSCVDSGLAYSSKTVPASSLAAGATSESLAQGHGPPSSLEHNFMTNLVGPTVNYDDISIIPTKNLNELNVHKLHKKAKKPKEGKIKKKKDKKDKTKHKEKEKDKGDEKNFIKGEKPKSLEKKQKKEKKKDKEKLVPPDMLQLSTDNNVEGSIGLNCGLGPVAVTVTESFQTAPAAVPTAAAALVQHLTSPKLDLSPNQVPKLTLKLSGKSTPVPTNQFDNESSSLLKTTTATTASATTTADLTLREHSPELARFSPLVTGPPKPKQCEQQQTITTAPTLLQPALNLMSTGQQQTSCLELGSGPGLGLPSGSGSLNTWMTPATVPAIPTCSTSASTISASSVLLPQQLLQAAAAAAASQSTPKMQPATITQSVCQQSVSPVKTDGSSVTESNRPSSYVDAEGYRIWICPACGKVDDGSAMIGCDGCDAWYHWVCVGIFVAPNDNEDWFCRVCVTKKKVNGPEKKKKRNKKK